MYGHNPNLRGSGEATRGECGRDAGKLNVGAYLEDVTAAEFCEEGGHGLVLEYELVTQLLELRLIQDRVLPDVGSNAEQREIC